MKRLLFCVFLLTVCLCGCSADEAAKITITDKQYETDYSIVNAQLLQLEGLADTEFQDSFNAQLSERLEAGAAEFDKLARETAGDTSAKYTFDVTQDVKYNKNDFVSFVEERYVYLGGAHGNTMRYPSNIDTPGAKTVTLGDLFEGEGYKDTLNRLIDEQVAENPEEYKDLWAKPEITPAHQSDFYISDGNLVIFFPPYELSYYARGFVEFELPLDELAGYLKEEYRRLVPADRFEKGE